jgi:hypothetical protein
LVTADPLLQAPASWLPQYRFFLINGNIKVDLHTFSRLLTARSQLVWQPSNTLTVDESIYDSDCVSPVHVYIPRKPHPNGLLSYGLAGYTAHGKFPMLLDLEPYLPANRVSAREAARRLAERFQENHPHLNLHLVADSAFGSFKEANYYLDKGILITMSMSYKEKPWLWDLLTHKCPLDSGRSALVPSNEPNSTIVASAFHTKSENDKIIDILTISTAFELKRPPISEETVIKIGPRRLNEAGHFEYETLWADGDRTWQDAHSFMDDDGAFNVLWLEKAEKEDIRMALDHFSVAELVAVCASQKWKVR